MFPLVVWQEYGDSVDIDGFDIDYGVRFDYHVTFPVFFKVLLKYDKLILDFTEPSFNCEVW